MDELFTLLEDSKRELQIYFEFLWRFCQREKKINLPKGTPLQSELQKILLSNSFILLYNTIEKICAKLINFIITTINNINELKLGYEELNPTFQKIWLNEKMNALLSLNTDNAKAYFWESIFNPLKNNESLKLKLFVPAGNFSFKEITDFCKKYDIKCPKGSKEVFSCFKIIKEMRNQLAHGNISFIEASQDRIFSDFKANKKIVLSTLLELLNNANDLITNEAYLQKNSLK